MSVLSHLEPKEVFHYFEEIASIPHGSGNMEKISHYIVDFAKEKGLKYIRDEIGNVIIFKNGSTGYENAPSVIVQSHLDMVCEKESDTDIDFENEGLRLFVKGDKIRAEGTTLGGDDGIGVAYALALLADKDAIHPPIEAIFTVDEEIGMLGAKFLDASPLKSSMMINIDSESEGILTCACAGGLTTVIDYPLKREKVKGKLCKLSVCGLTGGHSGQEINKGRANANFLLGRTLYKLTEEFKIYILSMNGGLKDNAIPRSSEALFLLEENENFKKLHEQILAIEQTYQNECAITDSGIYLTLSLADEKEEAALSVEESKKLISFLYNLPTGIQKTDLFISGLPQTSLNLGIMKTTDDTLIFSFLIRSSVESEKQELYTRLSSLCYCFGAKIKRCEEYPAWPYKKESFLRKLMVNVYKDMFDKTLIEDNVHAGLECGLFFDKIGNILDCVSIGPDIDDIHTPNETLHIKSTERTWNFLKKVLEELAKTAK